MLGQNPPLSVLTDQRSTRASWGLCRKALREHAGGLKFPYAFLKGLEELRKAPSKATLEQSMQALSCSPVNSSPDPTSQLPVSRKHS